MLDDSIMPAFNEGKPIAFKRVFKELYPQLLGLSFKIVDNREDAEDVVMHCMQIAFSKCTEFQYYLQLRKYLIIATRNISLNYSKYNKYRSIKTSKYKNQFIENIKDDYYLMLEVEVKPKVIKSLYDQIYKLKRSQREIILLTLQEWSSAAIANHMGISVHSVHVQKSRALERLKILFNKENQKNEHHSTASATDAARSSGNK